MRLPVVGPRNEIVMVELPRSPMAVRASKSGVEAPELMKINVRDVSINRDWLSSGRSLSGCRVELRLGRRELKSTMACRKSFSRSNHFHDPIIITVDKVDVDDVFTPLECASVCVKGCFRDR
jgi:hypothetical protein